MATAESRSRWAEIAITLAVSIIASVVSMTWTMSGTLSKFETTLANQEQRLKSLEISNREASSVNGAQAAQLAVQESRWADVLRRLDSIDRKLERP